MEEHAIHTTSDSTTLKWRPNLPLRRWWIFAFIVSLLVFSSALIFLGREANAKTGGGNLNPGDLASGGSGSHGHANPGGDPGGGRSGGGSPTGGVLDRQPVQQQLHRAAGSTPQPAQDTVADPALNTVRQPTNNVQKQLSDTAQPVLNTARQPTNGVQKQLGGAVQPVLNTVEQTANDTQKQLNEATQPVLKGVQDQLNQTAQPILNTAEQTLSSENQPSGQTLDPVEQRPTQQTSDEPVTAPIQQPSASVPHEDTNPSFAPALEGSAIRTESQSPLPHVMGTLVLQATTSSSVLEASRSASFDLSGFASTIPESIESSSTQLSAERKQAALASESEHSVIFNSPAGGQSISVQVPQPPPAGTMPGSLSAVASSTFGGSGFGLGILAFLTALLLGGVPLWSRRDSLATDSALHLIPEHPG
jgi:hypothetical protein